MTGNHASAVSAGAALERFTLVLAGDTSLGDSYLQGAIWTAERERLERNPLSFFEGLVPLIADPSYLVANLETVLTRASASGAAGKAYLGWDDPQRTVNTLRSAGVDAVSLANNHSMDFGPDALLGGVTLLEGSGIRAFGAGIHRDTAMRPLTVSMGRRRLHILGGFEHRPDYDRRYGFYAGETNAGVSGFDLAGGNALATMAADLRAADPNSLIVAYPHWGGGKNYSWATREMRDAAGSMLAAGADLVVGHGAHMLQHCSVTDLGTVAFSLGNFVFNTPGRYGKLDAPPYSLICRLQLAEGVEGHLEGELKFYPIVSDNRQTGFRPRPVNAEEARAVYEILVREGEVGFEDNFGLDCDERGWFIALLAPIGPRIRRASWAVSRARPKLGVFRVTTTQETARPQAGELVSDCVRHLFSLVGENGKFVYAHRFLDVSEAYTGYNLLRHCGTVWFMTKAVRLLDLELTPGDANRLERAVGYIGSKLARPSWSEGLLPLLCLTSKDAVKLGGVGLAILMIRGYRDLCQSRGALPAAGVLPDEADFVCAQLENYIVAQSTGDDFLHKRAFSTGRILPFRSDYYTGEALFALAQSGRRHVGIATTMEGLLARGYGIEVQSHWMAYAAVAAVRSGYCNTELTTGYLVRLVERIISDNAYRARHESTPIACRSEALAEILLLVRDHPEVRASFPDGLVERARATLDQNLRLQLAFYGSGQFKKGRASDKVQIDYIQHNGAAFLGGLLLNVSPQT